MKKSIAKFMTFAALTGMLTCSTALAAEPIEYTGPDTDGNINVSVTVTAAAEETTLLVIPTETTIEQAFADTTKVYYINQAAADADKIAHFKFTAPAEGSYTIYSGYATMSPTAEPFKQVLDLSEQPPQGDLFMFGDVNNDTYVNISDVGCIIQHIVNNSPFMLYGSQTEEYNYGKASADVDHDGLITTSDVGYIIQNIVNNIPLPEVE